MVSASKLLVMTGVETLNAARGKLARKANQLHARHAHGRQSPALVLMTDDSREVDWVEAVRALPSGSAVVVRHRDGKARERLARALRGVARERGVKLLIADDAALALRVRADGVHVPEKHVTRIAALRARHAHWFVSASAHNARAVAAASRAGADGVLIAPVFATGSHPGRRTLGALRLTALATQARIGVYALGGIDCISVQRLIAAPLNGVALIGGWTER